MRSSSSTSASVSASFLLLSVTVVAVVNVVGVVAIVEPTAAEDIQQVFLREPNDQVSDYSLVSHHSMISLLVFLVLSTRGGFGQHY